MFAFWKISRQQPGRRLAPGYRPLLEVLEDRLAPAGLPEGFVDTQYAVVDDPISMEFAPDGRLFVAEKSGDLRVISDDVLLAESFLSLDVDTTGERGLLSVAF